MPSAALARLESLLQTKKLDVTVTRPLVTELDPRARPSGVRVLDVALGGGWRRGEVSELVGASSSGRTSLLIASLAQATRQGEVVALVDAADRFDPSTAAAAGLDLSRVLWVRGPAITIESASPVMLDRAVHQAVRALDLIIRAGGFAIAALDVAGVPPIALKRLPWTTWMRLAHSVEGRETAVLLTGDAPMGKSARGASVRLDASARWAGESAQRRQLAGVDLRLRTGTRADLAARLDARGLATAIDATDRA